MQLAKPGADARFSCVRSLSPKASFQVCLQTFRCLQQHRASAGCSRSLVDPPPRESKRARGDILGLDFGSGNGAKAAVSVCTGITPTTWTTFPAT